MATATTTRRRTRKRAATRGRTTTRGRTGRGRARGSRLSNVPLDFLQCRDFGHAWKWLTDFDITNGPRNTPIEAKRLVGCLRCEATRVEVFELPTFALKSRGYHLPVNYSPPKGSGRVMVAEVRQEYYNRVGARAA